MRPVSLFVRFAVVRSGLPVDRTAVRHADHRNPGGHRIPPRRLWCVADLDVTRSLVIPAAELSERFSRSSGPGGQGVNTADSRVELSWDVAGSAVLAETLRTRLLTNLSGRLVDGVLTVACQGQWCRTSYRGRGGYVSARLLQPISRSVPLAGRGTVFYPTCAAMRADHAAPIRLGRPGYRAALDRDHDGWACRYDRQR